jgi:hypothetical protein
MIYPVRPSNIGLLQGDVCRQGDQSALAVGFEVKPTSVNKLHGIVEHDFIRSLQEEALFLAGKTANFNCLHIGSNIASKPKLIGSYILQTMPPAAPPPTLPPPTPALGPVSEAGVVYTT